MKKYKNKYRTQSQRKPGWDYSSEAFYFLTLLTQNRDCNLAEITDGKINLLDFGKIIEQEWLKSFEIRKELFLHAFVIMPNHIHCIVEINNSNNAKKNVVADSNFSEYPVDAIFSIKQNKPIRLPKSISSFIAGFKSAVNNKIDNFIDEQKLAIPKYNRKNHFFQPDYHDHVIRNDGEFIRISNYIHHNPKNWGKDKLKKHFKGR
jgi:REP element-mobilizing transposase RayT